MDWLPWRTDRLVLRRFREQDAEAFAAYRSDPEVARHQSWSAPYPLEAARAFVAEMSGAPADVPGEWFQVAVSLTEQGPPVGDVAFSPREHEPRIVEIGFTVAPGFQGRGFGTEAVTALLDVLFGRLGKHRVTASCDLRNTASRRLLERVGMRLEGHLVESYWDDGEWTDDLLFAVLEREWRRPGPDAATGGADH